MREDSEFYKKSAKAAGVLLVAFLVLGASDPSSVSLQRVIHEAENLSLNKDRVLACGVLWRNLKKADKADSKVLREKLLQLSRYYYTDKGFQAFLGGKEFFVKQKYQDALDKFLEADDLEAGNVEVLHYLTLTQLWLKKWEQAQSTNKRAEQTCPGDIEVQRDLLVVQVGLEDWVEAADTGQKLIKEFSDLSPQSLQLTGVALAHLNKKPEARKLLEQALKGDPRLPETCFWLYSVKDEPDVKLLTKYVELCKNRVLGPTPTQPPAPLTEREINFCSHLQEAEKKIGS